MIRKKTSIIVAALILAAGAFVVPVGAQSSKDRLEQILALLMSYGDVSTSWSRALPAADRFVVLADFNNEAVLDRNTGLVWQRTPGSDARFLMSASYHCLEAKTGGQKGWRLPSITELNTLVDPSVTTSPTLPAGHPFDFGEHVFFWSGTRLENTTDLAWSVNFRHGFIDDVEFFYSLSYLCVRGGARVDPY